MQYAHSFTIRKSIVAVGLKVKHITMEINLAKMKPC